MGTESERGWEVPEMTIILQDPGEQMMATDVMFTFLNIVSTREIRNWTGVEIGC